MSPSWPSQALAISTLAIVMVMSYLIPRILRFGGTYPPNRSMSMAEGLTTTSYAILGLLAVKPWTTYELAQQMKRAVGQFWPRAESNLYAEPKKLVALGLATASQEKVGNRPRTALHHHRPRAGRRWPTWMPDAGGGAGARVRGAAQGLLRRARVQGRPPGHHRERPGVDRGADGRHRRHPPGVPRRARARSPSACRGSSCPGSSSRSSPSIVGRWAEWAAERGRGRGPTTSGTRTPDWPTLEAMAVDADDYLRRAAERRRTAEEATS